METYRHFYLYAKCWYKKTDTLADLQRIASEWTANKNASVESTIRLLLDATFEKALRGNNPKRDFGRIVEALREDNSKENLANVCLAIIGSATGVSLDKPDPSILPLANETKL